jgi:hypothetical protein
MKKKIFFILFSFCNIFADEEISHEGINCYEKTNEGVLISNLDSKEDILDYEDLNSSIVEENGLMNKNNWNTRKWAIYFIFPHLSFGNIYHKFADFKIVETVKKSFFFIVPIEQKWLRILNCIFSGIVEYKWFFYKYCGINVRLNLNTIESYYPETESIDYVSFFSLDISFEWIYRRKNKHIWSGSISPIGFAFVQKNNGEDSDTKLRDMCTFEFFFLKYEYKNVFYINTFKIKSSYYNIYRLIEKFCVGRAFSLYNVENPNALKNEDFGGNILLNFFTIEFGINIIGLYDCIKKEIRNGNFKKIYFLFLKIASIKSWSDTL